MKKVDPALFAELVSSIILQAKKDVADYFDGKGSRTEAMDAIRFLFGEEFEWYMNQMNMPQADFDMYRRSIIKGSLRSERSIAHVVE